MLLGKTAMAIPVPAPSETRRFSIKREWSAAWLPELFPVSRAVTSLS